MKFAVLVCLSCWGALTANSPANFRSDEDARATSVSASAPTFVVASPTGSAESIRVSTADARRQEGIGAACIPDCESFRRVDAGTAGLQENAEQIFEEAKAWEGSDPLKSRSLYERACDLDHGESCSRGALLYENGSLNRSGAANTIASYRLYIFGCATSHWKSCFMLGQILTQRHSVPYPNVPRDMASGFRYYELACANGVKQACDNLRM